MTINPYLMLLIKMLYKSYKAKFLIWLTKQPIYAHVVLRIIPFIRFSTYYTKMRGRIYHKGYALLQPGDMILTMDRKKISTVIIGGEFAHAGFCVSKDQNVECLEMTHKHFTKSTFADMCFEADRVVIIRCNDFDPEYIQKMIQKAFEFENAKYDVAFHLNNEFLYCSELIYEADFERRLLVNLEDLAGIGNEYLSPTGLYKAKNVAVIWDSSKEV